MTKQVIEQLYEVAVMDYQVAHNESEQWDARKRMAELERTASELYGFDYADSLESLKSVLKGC